jgi:hypothetical protein
MWRHLSTWRASPTSSTSQKGKRCDSDSAWRSAKSFCSRTPAQIEVRYFAAGRLGHVRSERQYNIVQNRRHDELFARSPRRPRAVDGRIRRSDATRPPTSSPFSTLKTNHTLKTCTSSEAPSDSSLSRCQDVALLDLAVPQNSRLIPCLGSLARIYTKKIH